MRERERMLEFIHFMEHGIGRIPSSGTGLVLEASSTAPELPFNPIPVIPELDDGIGYWIPVRGRRYRQIPAPDDGRRTLEIRMQKISRERERLRERKIMIAEFRKFEREISRKRERNRVADERERRLREHEKREREGEGERTL